jgi:uncharacterized coiled-coil DUF342 family protein
MNAQSYLKRIKWIETQIRHRNVEKRRWRELATNITASMDGERVSSSGNKQRMASAIESGIDKERLLNQQIKELSAERQEIIDTIEMLPEDESDILYRAYVEYQPLKEVAYARKEAYSTITGKHGTALRHIQEILNSREKTNGCE